MKQPQKRPSSGKKAPQSVTQFFARELPAKLRRIQQHGTVNGSESYHVTVTGPAGGEWTIELDSSGPKVLKGLHGTPTRRLKLHDRDFRLLIAKERVKPVALRHGSASAILLATRPPVVVPAETLGALITFAFIGTTIKVDHRENEPRSATGAWSFVQFSPLLQARGLADRDLDIPIKEGNLGDFGQLLSLAVGGWYVVDRVRYLVNNLRTTIGFETLTVSLEPDTIVLNISFATNNPALWGEGNAYLAPLFGIPVGWSDAAFPDLHLTDFVISLRLRPVLTSLGNLALHDMAVSFDAKFPGDPIAKKAEPSVRAAIQQTFVSNFNTAQVRAALAVMLREVIASASGKLPANWTAMSIEPDGVAIWGYD